MGIVQWNTPKLWKESYGGTISDQYFFAEDIFGNQFGIDNTGVIAFDPETGKSERIAGDLDGWADCLLTDYNYLTGYPLAHEWQIKNGRLEDGYRLLPKVPFVCGGKYELDNLHAIDAVKGMNFRASIARQIRDLPDGAKITFNFKK